LKRPFEDFSVPGVAHNQNTTRINTRDRLLEAAGEIFAQKGYHSTTVRAICRRARSNVAAVNYYFGNKRRLYAAVLQYAHRCAIQKHPPDHGLPPDAPPQDRLKAFVRSLLQRLFDQGKPAWHNKLIAREIIEPTGALESLVRHSIKPQYEALSRIIEELLGNHAPAEEIRSCTNSVVGQCMHLYHSGPVLARLMPDMGYEPADIERWADHIARFSLAAIQKLRDEDGSAA
jgi:AcrR family transcriptional regulator